MILFSLFYFVPENEHDMLFGFGLFLGWDFAFSERKEDFCKIDISIGMGDWNGGEGDIMFYKVLFDRITLVCYYGRAMRWQGSEMPPEVVKEEHIMKKRFVSACMVGLLAVSLAGCGGTGDSAAEAAKTTAEEPKTEAATTAAESSETSSEAVSETSESGAEADGAEEGTFTVGFDQDFPPMGFVGDDGEYTGFDLELAQEVASRMGLKYVPQPIAWDAKDMELEAGTIDCIWNGFTMNGREDAYTWSDPYMDNSQVFVVAADSGISTLADLAGKVVEVQTDSSAEAALKDNQELSSSFGTLQTVADYNTAFMDLEMGAVDAIAMDVIVAGYQIEQREDGDNYVILEETLAAEEYGIGFKKGNEELRDKVQTTLEEMAADGTMAEISNKWFGRDVTVIGK